MPPPASSPVVEPPAAPPGRRPFLVALTGNPNCGKTTLFNALTGLRAKVGNYAGVTVERKEGPLQGAPPDRPVTILDLPGTYSLSPQSLDEQIVRDVLLARLPEVRPPDLVVVVVDASNLERNLYYATQVLELGYPTLIALNMVDVARDNGLEVVESRSDPRRPQDLLLPYTQTMMLGCVVRPEHDRALMLGLGGGSMAAFLAHHFPNLKLDVVEIDPAVVKIADELFGVRSAGNVRILTDDAFAFIRQTQQRYDAIYLDAFLKPSADTDETGKPLRLKTLEFYKQVRARLVDGGVVVFNVNDHDRLDDDLRAIRESFPQVYVFHAPPGNTIAIGSTDPRRLDDPTLRARARGLDAKLRTNFSFENLLERRRPSQR